MFRGVRMASVPIRFYKRLLFQRLSFLDSLYGFMELDLLPAAQADYDGQFTLKRKKQCEDSYR